MSAEVQFAKLDKDFAPIKKTTLIQRCILSMCCHFPDGMRYDNVALGKIFQASPDRISHLITDLDQKGFLLIRNAQSKYRVIYLNPRNPTLGKIAKCHEADSGLHRDKSQSTKCLHCYFHRSTSVFSPMSLKEEGIKNKEDGANALGDEIDISTKAESPSQDNGAAAFETFWVAWPKRVAKEAARKAFERITPDPERDGVATLPELHVIILAAIKKQKLWREQANGNFRPEWAHPATWLNGFRWNDVVETNEPISEAKPYTLEQLQAERIAEQAEKEKKELEYNAE